LDDFSEVDGLFGAMVVLRRRVKRRRVKMMVT
jgi:hypothetical protein